MAAARRGVRARARRCTGRLGRPGPVRPRAGAGGGGGSGGGDESAAGALAERVLASPLFYVTAGAAGAALAVKALGESGLAVFAVAALPIGGLTALSRSGVGEGLQAGLEERRAGLEAGAEARREAVRQAASRATARRGPQRRLLPLVGAPPAHLDGSHAGDYGFDPLSLGAEGRMGAMVTYELLHARWAMLAAVGCVVPEALASAGVPLGEAVWWKVGAAKASGGVDLNYAGVEGLRIAGGQGVGIIAACQLVLMGGPEYARYVGLAGLEPVGIFLPGTEDYPGGEPFDPLGLSEDADAFVAWQDYEVGTGRAAMVAMAAFAAQAAATRDGPVANLRAALG